MMVDDKRLITVREAAERFGVTEFTIRNWVRLRKISSYKRPISRMYLVDADELERKMTIVEQPADWEQEQEQER